MYIMAQKRLPQNSYLGIWRRLLCFLAGERLSTLSTSPGRSHISPLLAISDGDCDKVHPDATVPIPTPQPPVSSVVARVDDLELYVGQLQDQIASFRDQRIESARKIEATLIGMSSVLGTICDHWSGGTEGGRSASEAAARVKLGFDLARQGLGDVQRLLAADNGANARGTTSASRLSG